MANIKNLRIKLTGAAAIAVLVISFLPSSALAAQPLLALFDLQPADPSDQGIASESSQLLKNSLREIGKIQVVQIFPDLPSIKLALAEGRISQDELSRTGEPVIRKKLAAAIGANYYLGGGIGVKDGRAAMVVDMADIQTGKNWQVSSEAAANALNSPANRVNALKSMVSTVVSQLNNDVFSSVPQTTAPAPPVAQANPPAAAVPDPDNRIQRAEDFLKKGNTAAAIYEIRRAIQSDPKNVDLRLTLARAYTQVSMFHLATQELNRVLEMDPNNTAVLEQIFTLNETRGVPGETIAIYEKLIAKNPDDISLRIALGDLLWRKSKIDDAMKHYQAANNLDKDNTTAHDRLARCYAAKSQFDKSLAHLNEIARLGTDADSGAGARYTALMAVVEGEIKSISSQFSHAAKAFENQEHTREQYYELIRSLTSRSDMLTDYLDKIAVPTAYSTGHSHRVLACSLLSQAAISMMAYLETNKTESQEESKLYIAEAGKELTMADTADAKATATPAPTPATPTEAAATPATSGG